MKYFFIACIIVLFLAILALRPCEGFGMSPGTLDQLESTSTGFINQPYLLY
jgi:hypothetical protein